MNSRWLLLLSIVSWSAAGASAPTGADQIAGRVFLDGQPVAGALVEAITDPGELLQELECPRRGEKGASVFRCNWCPAAFEKGLGVLKAKRLEPVASVHSNADGSFKLAGLSAGPYALWIRAPESLAVIVEQVARGATALRVELRPAVAVAGVVVDPDGKPVSGQTVMVIPEASSRVLYTSTGADGLFRVAPLPRGKYQVVAEREGFQTTSADFDPVRSDQKLLLRLRAPASLRVRVVGADKRAQRGVEVEVRSAHESFRGRTEADGTYTFAGLRRGQYWARASAEGTAGMTLVSVGEANAVEIPLLAAAAIEVEVRDQTGSAVAGAAITLLPKADAQSENMVFVTDERGALRDRSLSPGKYFVSVKRYGFLDLYNTKTSQYGEYVELTAAKTKKIRLTLTRNVPLGGTLVDSHGLPIFNAWIGAQPVVQLASGGYAKDDSRPYTSENTGRSGGFTMKEALAGNYLLFVRGEGHVPFWVPARAPDASVRLQAPAGGVIVGKVVDEHGVPVEGATVQVPHVKDTRVPTLDPENADKSTRTSPTGDFRIEGLGPGAQMVRATLFGLEAGGARCEPSQPTAEKAIEVQLDRESRVQLRLPAHQCSVE